MYRRQGFVRVVLVPEIAILRTGLRFTLLLGGSYREKFLTVFFALVKNIGGLLVYAMSICMGRHTRLVKKFLTMIRIRNA